MLPPIIPTIEACLKTLRINGKGGKQLLQPTIAAALRAVGYNVDLEDAQHLLKAGMPVWRSKDTGEVEPTRGRRKIDIVAYDHSIPVALIETESDLNDLRLEGVTRRNGHYDVFSIAGSADGEFFNSYNSLERMACCAFFWDLFMRSGTYPQATSALEKLLSVKSNSVGDHNPSRLPLILVTGSCRPIDRQILEPRLRSLGGTLISASHNVS